MFDALMESIETNTICIGAGEIFEIFSSIIKGLSVPLKNEYKILLPHILIESLRVLNNNIS